MAGGRGTRLQPYTTVLPKPLMPVGDRPIVDVLLRQLDRAGIESVSISVGYLGSLIESWVRQEAHYRVPVSFVYEDEPLGTAGSLALVEGLEGTFLAMNGDILTTLSFADLVEQHRAAGAIATLAVTQRVVSIDYGVVHADEQRAIVGFEEKPKLEYTVSMGIYAFDARILEYIERGERVDFPDLLLRAMAGGETVSVFPFRGYWRDIGTRDDYEAATVEFLDDPARFVGDGAAPR